MFIFFQFFQLEKTHQQVLSHCLHPRACVFMRVFSQMTLHSRYATRLNKYTVLRCRLSQKWLFSIPRSVLQLREMDFISVFQRLCLSKKVFLMLIIYMRQRQIILNICFAEEQAFTFNAKETRFTFLCCQSSNNRLESFFQFSVLRELAFYPLSK